MPDTVARAVGAYVPHDAVGAASTVAADILGLWPTGRDLCVFCVGTDRCTGDAFGPCVGSELEGLQGVSVVGTLDSPVTATNLDGRLRELRPGAWTLAVDANLGLPAQVGSLHVAGRPLRPGVGAHRNLSPVGDARLLGTVGVGGAFWYGDLQNVRLALVVRLARVAAEAVRLAVWARMGVAEAAAAREVGADA